MTELPSELRYRLTYADWRGWNEARIATVQPPTYASVRSWTLYWASWVNYVFTLIGWAVLATALALTVVDERWEAAIFLVALLIATSVSSVRVSRAKARREAQQEALYEASILSQGELVLRIGAAGLDVAYSGLSMQVPWASVRSVRWIGAMVLVIYDDSLGGIGVPISAFAGRAQADEFMAGVQERTAASGLRADRPDAVENGE